MGLQIRSYQQFVIIGLFFHFFFKSNYISTFTSQNFNKHIAKTILHILAFCEIKPNSSPLFNTASRARAPPFREAYFYAVGKALFYASQLLWAFFKPICRPAWPYS